MLTLPAAVTESAAPAQSTDFATLFAQFVDYLDTSPKTVETYVRALRQWGQWLAASGVSSPRREDVLAYRRHLECTHAAGTARCYLVAVKALYRWTALKGLYPNIADVRNVKTDASQKKDPLTSRQAHEVLEAARGTTEEQLRNYAILALLLSCGLRTIEAVRANVSHMRPLGNETVLYVHGKGRSSADTFVRLPAQVEDAIRAYLAVRGRVDGTAPLFASVSRRNRGERLTTRTLSGMVKAAFLRVGLNSDRLTAHSCRHTAVTLALIAGRTIQEAAQFARHAHTSTTEIYAHNLDRLTNPCAHAVAAQIF